MNSSRDNSISEDSMTSERSSRRSHRQNWLVDAHCHLHERFDLDRALDAAFENAGPHGTPVLLLADVPGGSSFAWLDTQPARRWQFEPLEGGRSRRARHMGSIAGRPTRRSADVVLLVAGRQITSTEGLEVLALGCLDPLPSELDVRSLLGEIQRAGGLAVMPWGFGKWTGRRGRILDDLLREEMSSPFFLGDNGGRFGSGLPRQFQIAATRSILILPGSDPLPLRNQEARVGAYGFKMDPGDLDQPWSSVQQALQQNDFRPQPRGSRVGFWAFFLQQLSMLLRKHVFGPR